MRYVSPNSPGSLVQYPDRYDHYINGEWVPPARGRYFENVSPVTGRPFIQIARGTHEDVERALDAAHAAKAAWGATPAAARAQILNRIADVMEQNLEQLAVSESWDNGKPIRETLAADLPPDLLQVPDAPAALGTLSDDALDVVQANAIRRALDACAGNVSAAARRLGVARSTIYRALQRRGD